MHRTARAVLAAPLSLLVLAACTGPSTGPATGGPAPAASAATPASAPSAQVPAEPTPSAEGTGGGRAPGGSIVLTGAVKGSLTVAVCHDGTAQLVLAVDGQDTTYNGLIDADDFTFVGPGSTGYTLADGTPKPQVSGSTYTVRGTELVSITSDDTVTANGSVTCPS